VPEDELLQMPIETIMEMIEELPEPVKDYAPLPGYSYFAWGEEA